MTVYRNISGTWKSGTFWRNISGTWKQVTVWRNISGTWKAISSTVLDTQTITCGTDFTGPGTYVAGFLVDYFGTGSNLGVISDGISNIYSGAPITGLFVDTATPIVQFRLQGSRANSGWTTMNISGTAGSFNYTRSAAAYSSNSTVTSWTWGGGLATDFTGLNFSYNATATWT